MLSWRTENQSRDPQILNTREQSSKRCTYRITSYINNLHPVHHQPLYPLIETLIDASIPLWNSTLAPCNAWELRIKYHEVEFKVDIDALSNDHPEAPVQGPDEDEDDYWQRFEAWRWDFAGLILPEPEAMVRKSEISKQESKENVDLKHHYKGLQVIVKLANIVLTPESPVYEGGTWHVEGQKVCIVIPVPSGFMHAVMFGDQKYAC